MTMSKNFGGSDDVGNLSLK
jgi:hypothetical protein